MHSFDTDYTTGVFDTLEAPCLSLYQPTHRSHPDNEQDPIRFRNLVKKLEASLTQKYEDGETKKILKPFNDLAENAKFWNHSADGLIVFAADGFFRYYQAQRPVAELAVVADSFHLKPLLRIQQSADRYHILTITGKEVTLYEANRYGISQVTLSEEVSDAIDAARDGSRRVMHVEVSPSIPGSVATRGGQGAGESDKHDDERYLREIDRAILKHYTRPSGLPLILVSLPENNHGFRRISRNPLLVGNAVETNPDSLSDEEIRERAWQAFEPHYEERLTAVIDTYGAAQAKHLATDDLEQAVKAADAGRIATLLLEADRHIPGRYDDTSGEITRDELENPEVDDLLDDLGEMVLRSGGQVLVMPKNKMPTESGLAAIYRF